MCCSQIRIGESRERVGLRAGIAYHALASGMVQCASSRSRLARLSLSLCPAHLSSWSCGRSQQLPLFSQPPSNFLRFAAENLYYATRCTPNTRRHVCVPSDHVQPRPRHSRGSSTSTRRERCPGSPRMMQASTGLLRCACARAWYAEGMRGGGRHACADMHASQHVVLLQRVALIQLGCRSGGHGRRRATCCLMTGPA